MLFKSFTMTKDSLKQLAEQGEGRAVIATLNVIDHDNDVSLPGAFDWMEQNAFVIPHHNWHSESPPLGKTAIKEDGDDVIAHFKLNLKTHLGSDWREHLKFDLENGSPRQEWSYGFDTIEAEQGELDGRKVQFLKKQKVHEISPVILGAGIDTRTLDVKSAGDKRAVGSHSTAVNEGRWDGPGNERKVRTGETPSYYRKVYAWQDPDKDPKTKSAWRFIHHFVEGGGEPEAASTVACQSAIAILNGGRLSGGSDALRNQAWFGDRKGIWNHLARHLRDAGLEPPELKEDDGETFKMKDHFEFVEASLAEANSLMERFKSLADIRSTEGRDWYKKNQKRIMKIADLVTESQAKIQEINQQTEENDGRGVILEMNFRNTVKRFAGVTRETA